MTSLLSAPVGLPCAMTPPTSSRANCSNRGPITVRHDRLVKAVAHGFRAAGAYTRLNTAQSIKSALALICPWYFQKNRFWLTWSYLIQPPSRISVAPLACARRAEKAKVAKYGDLARSRGSRVLAFAVESYGAFGEHATSIIQLIRRALVGSPELEEDDAIHALLPQQLAITLQKGNALVSRVGSQRARQAARRP